MPVCSAVTQQLLDTPRAEPRPGPGRPRRLAHRHRGPSGPGVMSSPPRPARLPAAPARHATSRIRRPPRRPPPAAACSPADHRPPGHVQPRTTVTVAAVTLAVHARSRSRRLPRSASSTSVRSDCDIQRRATSPGADGPAQRSARSRQVHRPARHWGLQAVRGEHRGRAGPAVTCERGQHRRDHPVGQVSCWPHCRGPRAPTRPVRHRRVARLAGVQEHRPDGRTAFPAYTGAALDARPSASGYLAAGRLRSKPAVKPGSPSAGPARLHAACPRRSAYSRSAGPARRRTPPPRPGGAACSRSAQRLGLAPTAPQRITHACTTGPRRPPAAAFGNSGRAR